MISSFWKSTFLLSIIITRALQANANARLFNTWKYLHNEVDNDKDAAANNTVITIPKIFSLKNSQVNKTFTIYPGHPANVYLENGSI